MIVWGSLFSPPIRRESHITGPSLLFSHPRPPTHHTPHHTVFENNCNDFAAAAVRFLTGGEVEMPAYILDNSQNALSEMPQSQAALTRSIANQVGGCVC